MRNNDVYIHASIWFLIIVCLALAAYVDVTMRMAQ
jgi:hypothetical protein